MFQYNNSVLTYHLFEKDSIVYQCSRDAHRVCEMHIIISSAMDQEKLIVVKVLEWSEIIHILYNLFNFTDIK